MLFVLRKEKKVKLANSIHIRNSFVGKGTGLMFHRKIKDSAYIFPFESERKIAITMMFVFFSIDILFLNKENKIVEIKKCLKPFSNYIPKKKAMYVVELPEGHVDKFKIKLNEKIIF
jgi:uncharacterized membrane protein (UPF0127 family)